MKKTKIFLFSFLVASTAIALPTQQIQDFNRRYQLFSRNQKLVDNYGEGYEALYGVRNFRGVLRGILYRGGANNTYNRYGKRGNQNPLPTVGLNSLCQQNFKTAIYLYPTHFSSAPKSVHCENLEKQKNEISYRQISGLDAKNTDTFLEMIYKAIKGEIPSPLYMHCWNGWHASGLVSTLALRQFCGLDAETALKYWTENTDGNSQGYSSIKQKIRDFKPLPQFQISRQEQDEICFPN